MEYLIFICHYISINKENGKVLFETVDAIAEATFPMSYGEFAEEARKAKYRADLVLAHDSVYGKLFETYFLTNNFLKGRLRYSLDEHI